MSRMAGGAGTIQIPAYGASVAQEFLKKYQIFPYEKF
jgi:hypothetical protein